MQKDSRVIKHASAGILFALAIAVLFAFFLASPLDIKTDILELLPKSEESAVKQKAFEHLTRISSGRINILFGAKSIEDAKKAGIFFSDEIKELPIKDMKFLLDGKGIKDIIGNFTSHNYHIMSQKIRKLLEDKEYSVISQKAKAMFYSPVRLGIAPFKDDPFFLLPELLMDMKLLKSGLSPKSGVLAGGYGGRNYAFMSLELHGNDAFSPQELSVIMEKIIKAKDKTLAAWPDIEVNISGVPVHTYSASSNSILEISIISWLSFAIILAISYCVLRSISCFFYAMIPICTGLAAAFSFTHLCFGEIHVLTLVFGTSLIGLCIDYCLHYFIERSCVDDSFSALHIIGRAVLISMITSVLGFSVLLFSGLDIIRQMAVFSITGIICAYLVVVIFYPLIMKNLRFKEPAAFAVSFEKRIVNLVTRMFIKHPLPKIALFAAFITGGLMMLKANDDIRSLYVPKPELINAEKLFLNVSKSQPSLKIFIISGDDGEDVLQKEENLREKLEAEISKGSLGGYKAISELVPSRKTQRKNYKLAQALFKDSFPGYAKSIGLKPGDTGAIEKKFKNNANNFITPDNVLKIRSLDILESLWMPDINASIVVLESAKDGIESLDSPENGIFFLDKTAEFSNILSSHRKEMVPLIAILYALMLAMFLIRYPLKKALLSVSPAALSVLILLACFGYMGVSISFFHVIGIFLVITFGLDYTVFQIETDGRLKFAGLAVMLSCLTTMVSFGLLAFTSFALIRALGLTLFIGILSSYLISPIARLSSRSADTAESK